MAGVAAACGAGVVLMHSRGGPRDRLLRACRLWRRCRGRRDRRAAGGALGRQRRPGSRLRPSYVDPGLGFSKTVEQSLELFDQLGALQALGRPVLIGPSRKRFLGAVTGLPVEERDRATATACALAWERGARLFRVHASRRRARRSLSPMPSTARSRRDRRDDAHGERPPYRAAVGVAARGARRLRADPGAHRDVLGRRRVHCRRQDTGHPAPAGHAALRDDRARLGPA